MPPVIAAAAAFFTAVATAVTAAIASITIASVAVFVGKIILTIAITMVIQALTKKKTAGNLNQGQQLALKLDPGMPRQVMLGEIASGGSAVYAFTYTDDSKSPNKYLVRITSLSDIPINSILATVEGATNLAFTGDIYADMQPCTSHKNKAGIPCLYMKVIKGSFTPTADPWLIAHEPNGKWTSAHKGVGQAYVITRFTFDPDGVAFPNGEPSLYWVMEGAAVYDQRQDSTRTNPARSGTQRLNDPNSWAYSNNTAVLLQQALRGFSINGNLLMGAGALDTDLNDSMLLSAYNACDSNVTLADGVTTERRYRSGYIMQANSATQTTITDLINAMDGDLFDRGGAITLWPGVSHTPGMDLTDADIIWTEEKSYQPLADLNSLYNTVVGQFISNTEGYTQQPYPIQTNATYIADDGGERITLNRDFAAVTYATQTQRITARLLLRSRYQAVVGFVAPFYCLELEQGDWFTLTSERWGFAKKTFMVFSVDITQDMKVAIIAQEISSGIDNYNAVTQYVPPTDTTGSTSAPPALTAPDVIVTAVSLDSADGLTKIPGIQYSITIGSSSATTGVNIRLRLAAGPGTPFSIGTVTPNPSVTGVYSGGLSPSTAYELSVQPFNALRTGDWGAWFAVTTTANLSVPTAGGLSGSVTTSGLTMNTSRLLGRTTAASGAIQEIAVGASLNLSSGIIQLAATQASAYTWSVKQTYSVGFIITPVTVATLGAAIDGGRAHVSDSTVALTAGIGLVVAGGGSNSVPVVGDGTNWRIG